MSDSAQIEYIPDWGARLLAAIYSQFRFLATWRAFIQSIADVGQSFEDLCWSLLVSCSLDLAAGVNLDAWGGLVGAARNGLDDATYRRFITQEIPILRCGGAGDELIGIFAGVCGVAPDAVLLVSLPPAGYWIQALLPAWPEPAVISAIARAMDTAQSTGIGQFAILAPLNAARFDVPGVGFDVGVFSLLLE